MEIGVMRDFVVGDESYDSDLKKYLVFFDEIIIPNIDLSIIKADSTKETEHIAVDINYLSEKQIIGAPPKNLLTKAMKSEDIVLNAYSRFRIQQSLSRPAGIRVPSNVTELTDDGVFREAGDKTKQRFSKKLEIGLATLIARELALTISLDQAGSRATYFGDVDYLSEIKTLNQADVFRFVFERLPTPSLATSLDQILEFRNNEIVTNFHLGLQRWMRNVVQNEWGKKDLELEFNFLQTSLELAMKQHGIDSRRSLFEATFLVSVEFAQNFVALKWSDMAKGLLKLTKGTASVLGNEIASFSGGKELGYLYLVQRELAQLRD